MSENSCCSFCEQLPGIARPGRGSAGKCPLCRQALWTTPDGTTHRVVEGVAAAPPLKWRWLAGVGLVAGLFIAAGIGRYAFQPEPGGTPQPVAVAVAAAAQDSETERVRPAPKPPVMRVKPALPADAARVKPLIKAVPPAPVQVAKATVKPVPWTFYDEGPRTKGVGRSIPSAWSWTSLNSAEDYLTAKLRDVPQVDLDPKFEVRSKYDSAKAAKEIIDETKNNQDAFVRRLMKERGDLAGLPFLLGKDCSMSKQESNILALHSLRIRAALSRAIEHEQRQSKSASYSSYRDGKSAAEHFWSEINDGPGRSVMSKASSIPALQQIVLAQDKEYRMKVVTHLKDVKGVEATRTLANRALFDLNADVRANAVEALRKRPKEEYRAIVMKAMRYPWLPVVRNATRATVTLQLEETIPELVALLDAPDPDAPFTAPGADGTPRPMVRELVRINHHRNCMLCHAPANAENAVAARELRETPVGPVPSIQDPLPPATSTVYYSARRGETLVRADITYLRQDFSLQQHVDAPGHWPHMQRFDFLVRTRELTGDELAQRTPAAAISEYKEAVADALRSLTGKNAPPQAQAWRELLELPAVKNVQQAK